MKYAMPFLLVCLFFTACDTTTSDTLTNCVVSISLDTDHGLPGDEISASGTPFSTTYDSLISFNGVTADVTDVTRNDCSLCDSCREEAACAPCGACVPCLLQCDACQENISFLVPDAPTGSTTVTLINAFGTSTPAPFEIDRHPLATTNTGETGR
jgi:hypothetical protein